MRTIWNRLKGEDEQEKKDNVVVKTGKSALKKVIAKFLVKIFLKLLPYMAVAVAGVVAVSRVVDLINDVNNPQYLYDVIGKQDLNELIAIAGNEEDGYYIAYKEGLDEKLDEIVENYKEAGYQYVNKNVLLKMIQAELYTQYPNLGGKIGHEAKVEETESTDTSSETSAITSLEGFLFIGDSITEGLRSLKSSENKYKFVSKGSVQPGYWIENFSQMPDAADVKGINVFLGTNGVWGEKEKTISDLKSLLEKLHEKYPNCTIFVNKIFTTIKGTDKSDIVNQYNNEILQYCEGRSYLTCIEATSGIELSDGTHPKDYQTLWDNIEKAIMDSVGKEEPPLILGEDTGEGTKGFQGGVRIRRVMPNKAIGEMKNTGSGEISSGQTMSGDIVSDISTILQKNGVAGTWSVYAKNLKSGNEIVQYNANDKKQSASLIKLFVAATAYQEMKDNNSSIDENLIKNMITVSDNEATNTIIKQLGNGDAKEGMNKINSYIRNQGYEKTEIKRLMLEDATDGDNYTSTTDVAKILEAIYNKKCVSKSASEKMLEYLKAQERTSKIPAGVPEGVVTANKTGELDTVQNDAAIVYKDGAPYILVVMSSDIEDTSGAIENIKDISKKVYEKIDQNKEEDSNNDSKEHVIALVIGHGEDSGAGTNTYTKGSEDTTGVTSPAWKETEKLQEVIELVKKKLKSNDKITIITDGYGQPESERLQIAKEKGADVFIELHLGYNSDSSVDGTSAYYIKDTGKKSEKLANTLVDSVVSSLNTAKNDGAATTSSKVITKSKVEDFGGAAVILNGAFMSNEGDMKKISAKDGLDKYAQGIAEGITSYINLLDEGKLEDDEELINEEYDSSIKSKIIEMKYIPQDKFDEMLEKANDEGAYGNINDEILKYYTLDGKWNLITARWTYSSETGITFSKNTAMPYRSTLKKYMTPFEYLMNYYIDIKEDDFIKAFANLIMDSEFIIAVQDNVTTTHTTVDVKTVYSDGHVAGGGNSNKDEITESVSDSIELTYVDTWFVKFWKDSSYIYGNGTGYRGGLGSKRQQAVADRARNSDLPTKEKNCESWAEKIYRKEGYDVEEYDSPFKAADVALPNGDTSQDNIPIGALVFGNSKDGRKNDDGSDAGMVGIYIGNNEVASIKEIVSLDKWIENYGWKGWGWYPGTEELAKTTELTTYGSLTGELTGKSLGTFTLTGYCPCQECSEGWGTQTSSGREAIEGVTIAVDNSVIPEGSYVYFNGFVFRADDVGGGVKGNHIDVFCNKHEDTFNWEGQVEVFEVDPSTVKEGETSGDASTEVSYLNTNASLMGKVTTTSTSSTTNEPGPSIPIYDKNNKWIDTIYSTIVTTTNTETIANMYEVGESNVTGNEAKFLKLFRDYPEALSRIKPKWLITATSKNDRTAAMLDLTKYLMYKLFGDDYGVTEFDFSIYEPDSFSSMSSNGGREQFIRWLHEWEGINGSISADGTKYIIGDDGYGHPTVGYGIDIFNGGFADRFTAAGYSTNIGAEVDKEFVDNLEKEEIDKAIEAVEAKCAGLNLTQYQKYALVSRIFNCGVAGAFTTRNGKDFVAAYTAYWDSDKDDEYGVAANESMFSHPLYSTYMYKPDTSNNQYSEGLVNRRRAEWLLFKTGYYDRIDEYYQEGADIESVCQEITQMLIDRNAVYGAYTYNDIETTYKSDPGVVCASYVSLVLYKSGLMSAEQINAYNYHYTVDYPNMLRAAGWKEVDKSDLQPGDVLNKPGDGNQGHVVIYVGNGLIYDQTSAVVSSSGKAPTGQPNSVSGYIGSGYVAWRAP